MLNSSLFKLSQSLANCPAYIHQTFRFATKKAGGSTRNGRDSIGRRLGLKKFGGEFVICGNIIIRQRGQKYHPDLKTVGMGRDHTLYALTPGYVKFTYNVEKKHQVVSVIENNPNPPPYFKKDKLGNIIDPLYVPPTDGATLAVAKV